MYEYSAILNCTYSLELYPFHRKTAEYLVSLLNLAMTSRMSVIVGSERRELVSHMHYNHHKGENVRTLMHLVLVLFLLLFLP